MIKNYINCNLIKIKKEIKIKKKRLYSTIYSIICIYYIQYVLKMASSFTHLSDSKSHPINLLEEITISKNWIFERPIEDEIYIEVPTKYSNLIIQVNWLKNQSRIEIRSFFYNKMDFSDNVEIYKLLNLINNRINYGHFIINENSFPTFKNSIIIKDYKSIKFDLLKELLNYAILESERFFPILQLVLWGGKKAEEAILFFDFETEGNA